MGSILECQGNENVGEPDMPKDGDFERRYSPWCQAHYVALWVSIYGTDIIESTQTLLEDVPLGIRTAHAADAYLRDYANKQHQQDLERSKENRPAL